MSEPTTSYAALKDRLVTKFGIKTELVPVADMPNTLREYDESRQELRLSEGLDHPQPDVSAGPHDRTDRA